MVPVGDDMDRFTKNDVILTPVVLLVVHPIDTDRHQGWPAGFRWGVHVGSYPVHDLRFCVNAGYCQMRDEAVRVGDLCAAAVTQALRVFGVPASLSYRFLDVDPLPPDANTIRFI